VYYIIDSFRILKENKHRDTEFRKGGGEKFLIFSFILRDSVPLWFFQILQCHIATKRN
jgi:hypothetical protein